MNRKNKAGFTLVELMVVAIIVAILAAVAIPLMSGNTKRAMATEAQAGCGTIKTALQVYKAELGGFPSATFTCDNPPTKLTIKPGDLDGKYFKSDGYEVVSTISNWTITATGYTNAADGKEVILKSDNSDFSGSLFD